MTIYYKNNEQIEIILQINYLKSDNYFDFEKLKKHEFVKAQISYFAMYTRTTRNKTKTQDIKTIVEMRGFLR